MIPTLYNGITYPQTSNSKCVELNHCIVFLQFTLTVLFTHYTGNISCYLFNLIADGLHHTLICFSWSCTYLWTHLYVMEHTETIHSAVHLCYITLRLESLPALSCHLSGLFVCTCQESLQKRPNERHFTTFRASFSFLTDRSSYLLTNWLRQVAFPVSLTRPIS